MRMWMLLDRENLASRGMRENIRLWIPQARSYFRFQRNQYIKTLGNSGMTVPEIRGRIQVELGDDLSDRSIARVLSKIQHLEE